MSSYFANLGPGKKKAAGLRARAELEIVDAGRFTIGQVATVGRAPDSDVVVNVRSVSRNHARIFYEGGHFWIKDLGSANGTCVNGKKITLQMLADQDQISFGEARAVFHTADRTSGPAALAQDPLAGLDAGIADGTPTSGLSGAPSVCDGKVAGRTPDGPFAGGADVRALTGKVETLQAENDLLRRELSQYRSTSAGTSSSVASEKQEIQRLQKLVNRLERALADSNLRLRNLQQLLDQKK